MKTELSKEDLETILTINELVDICLNIPTKEDIERIDRQIKLLEEYDKSHTESDVYNNQINLLYKEKEKIEKDIHDYKKIVCIPNNETGDLKIKIDRENYHILKNDKVHKKLITELKQIDDLIVAINNNEYPEWDATCKYYGVEKVMYK